MPKGVKGSMPLMSEKSISQRIETIKKKEPTGNSRTEKYGIQNKIQKDLRNEDNNSVEMAE